jgi:CheY-like chemotaxis protein
VLLVEDEPEVRKVIRQQLTELGYPVLEAANGLEAGPCWKPSTTSPSSSPTP